MIAARKCSLGILLLLVSLSLAAPARGDWKAGAARIDITPQKFMWMAGYGGRDHPAEGKATSLFAKALVLEDGDGDRGLLVTFDLIGIDRTLAQELCRLLNQAHGLERRQIVFCFSHTHSGPVVGRNLGPLHYLLLDKTQQALIDEYVGFLKSKVLQVVSQAFNNLRPSQLAWGNGIATYAVNRRNNKADEVPVLRTKGKLVGPHDHDVPVLSVRDSQGQLQAVVFGYACHATTLSAYEWNGDHPGYAQAELEAEHPGCVALFWAGCGADQNPLPRRTVQLARHYGRRLATAVDTVLMTTQMTPLADRLVTSFREVNVPLDRLPTREEVEKDAQSSSPYTAARAKMLLAQLDAGQPLSPTYPYPVSVWRIGQDIQFVTLGGEVVVDYALRLKAELSGPKTWVAGYSNDVMAYIPSLRVLKEGGYEGATAMVYYGLPSPWAPAVEDTIVREVHAQLGGAK